MPKKTISYLSIIAIVIGFIFLANGLILAWSPPGSPPPGGNVPAPLNVGNVGQSKAGGLVLNTGGAATGLVVDKGNVGIGTTNPGTKLDVRGNIITGVDGSGGRLILAANDGANEGGEIVWHGAGANSDWHQDINQDKMRFWSDTLGAGNNLVLEDGGKVGIGVTSPDAQARLHVKGNILAESGAASAGTSRNKGFYVWSDESFGMELLYKGGWRTAIFSRNSDADIALGTYPPGSTQQSNFSELMTIENSGNVGIGTTNPGEKLDVVGYVKGRTGLCIGDDCRDSWPGYDQSNCYWQAVAWGTTEVATLCNNGYYVAGVKKRYNAIAFDMEITHLYCCSF